MNPVVQIILHCVISNKSTVYLTLYTLRFILHFIWHAKFITKIYFYNTQRYFRVPIDLKFNLICI